MLTETVYRRNDHTGELEAVKLQETPPRTPRTRDFAQMKQPHLRRMTDPAITAQEYRVFFLLVEHCGWANKCSISRKKISTLLGITYTAVWRSLTKLKQRQIIYFDDTDRDSIFLDPTVCWLGIPAAVDSAAASFRQLFDPPSVVS